MIQLFYYLNENIDILCIFFNNLKSYLVIFYFDKKTKFYLLKNQFQDPSNK